MLHGFMCQINDWFEIDVKDYPEHDELEKMLKLQCE